MSVLIYFILIAIGMALTTVILIENLRKERSEDTCDSLQQELEAQSAKYTDLRTRYEILSSKVNQYAQERRLAGVTDPLSIERCLHRQQLTSNYKIPYVAIS